MMNSKKLCFWLLIFATVIAICSSPSAQAAEKHETVITIWHAMPQEYSSLFDSIMNEYPAKTSGLVRVITRRFNSQDDLHKAIHTGSVHPDVALIDTRWQGEFLRRHKLIPMEDLIHQVAGNSVYIVFKMDTFAPMWDSSCLNKKLISIPFTGYNRALIINNQVLSRYSKKTPTSWGDLIEISKAIAKGTEKENVAGGEKTWAFAIPTERGPEDLAAFFQVFLWQVDRDLVEPFMDGELAAFDGVEGVAILNMFKDMVYKHHIAPPVGADKCKVAMVIGSPQDYLTISKCTSDVKVVRWPGKVNSRNDLIVFSFVVFEGADKEKKEKIWHLLYEACEFKANLKWSLATPFLPPNKQVTLSPDYFEYLKAHPGMKTFLDQMKNARVGVLDEKREKVARILGEKIRACIDKQGDSRQYLEEAANQANIILDPGGTLRAKKAQLNSMGKYVDTVWVKDVQ